MFDLTQQNNEWLVVEIRLCRSILGISQKQLAEITGMALQSIKRLEKKGANARYTTVIKLRLAFAEMGLVCTFDENGNIQTQLSAELVTAINAGELKSYTRQALETIEMSPQEWFPE